MKATELRIGNWVCNDFTREDIEVYPMMIHRLSKIEGEHHIKPIPLTEEWLIKFGLKLHDLSSRTNPHLMDVVGKYRKNDLLEYVISSDDDSHGGWSYYTKKIEHVHQLQNLYFALTGEELTIKKDE